MKHNASGKYSKLAAKIRSLITQTTQKNGGHLASNLGVVELTIAIHKVFSSPEDKIIFDVSHQCYAHKILTDREGNFPSLRQTDGISGFTAPNESEHDVFYCGHAGTALSSALGIAIARGQLNQDYQVIAVIGDASLTNGLTLEALNNIGKTKVIIVLNDNGYAISKNVGFIAKYLNDVMRSNFYNRFKIHLKSFIRKIPLGVCVIKFLSHVKRLIKGLFLTSSFFEYYGLRYIGPVDGHNIDELIDALKFCKKESRPVLLHMKTKKGYGHSAAEYSPESTHGVSVNPSTGESYSSALGSAACILAEKNPRIVCVTAAMAQGTGLTPFQEQFPERFFDVGIAEGHAITFSAGLSKAGLFPICAIYSSFLQRAFDNIFHDIALQNLPIIIAIDRAGLCANDGPTHHGLFDIAFLRSIPNLIIMQPKNTSELKLMLTEAVKFHAPCCIRYPKTTYEPQLQKKRNHAIQNELAPIILGKSEVIAEGNDACIIALGDRIIMAMEIAHLLPQYRFTIINARFIKPLDTDTFLKYAGICKYIYTIEDHVLSGGFGSALAEFFSKNFFSINLHIFAWPDHFIPHASNNADLERMYRFTSRDFAQKIDRDLSATD